MPMALDHSGHQGGAGQVDDFGASGHGQRRADRDDLFAVDQDLPAGMRRGIDAVEHLRRAQQRGRGEGGQGGHQGESKQEAVQHGVHAIRAGRVSQIPI